MSTKYEKFALTAAVEYSGGGICSRQIIRNNAGSVILFSFDAGQTLSEHVAPCDSLIQILEGEAFAIIGGKEMLLLAGEAAILPANVPHALRAKTRFKMAFTVIKA